MFARTPFLCLGRGTVRINPHKFVKRALRDSSGIRQGHEDGFVDSFSRVLERCPSKGIFVKCPCPLLTCLLLENGLDRFDLVRIHLPPSIGTHYIFDSPKVRGLAEVKIRVGLPNLPDRHNKLTNIVDGFCPLFLA